MKFFKDKQGNALDSKEFLQRWKKGIQGITPLQQARIVFKNTWMIILGLILGIVFSLMHIKDFWWLSIILTASLMNTLVGQIGNYQKLKQLEMIENAFK